MSVKFSRRTALTAVAVAGITAPVVGTAHAFAEGEAAAADTSDHPLPLIGPVNGEDIHVMSYNIRVGTDGDKGARNWSKRRDRIVKTVKQEQPTILGVQEALLFQMRYLNGELPGYRAVYRGRDKDGSGECTGILYRTERLELLDHGYKWMSTTPNRPGSVSWGAKFPRMMTWAKFHDLASDREFLHVNCHFDHASEKSRRKSARYVRDWIGKHGLGTIVTGDFNTGPHGEPHDVLTEGRMHDVWSHKSKRITRGCGTANGWRAKPRWGGRRIDWILASGAVGVEKVGINTWVGNDGHVSSDHWAVQAVLRMK